MMVRPGQNKDRGWLLVMVGALGQRELSVRTCSMGRIWPAPCGEYEGDDGCDWGTGVVCKALSSSA